MAGAGATTDGQESFLRKATNHRLLSAPEERALARRYRDHRDERARHELIEHNVRLVVSIARRHANWPGALPYEDLIQEGMIGLDIASRKFDPERGIKFSTYATWWIRKAIQQGTARGADAIHLPALVQEWRQFAKAERTRTPGITDAQIAEKLEITPEQLQRALTAAEVSDSLDQDSQDDHSLLDQVADPLAADPADLADGSADAAYVRRRLRELPPLERQVLELRFGFHGDVYSLADIATALDVTPAAVRAAQQNGLNRLRDTEVD